MLVKWDWRLVHGLLLIYYLPSVCCMPKPEGLNRQTRAARVRISTTDAARYLGKYGFMSQSTTSRTIASITALVPSALKTPIRRFQHLAGIRETGVLDEKTMRYMTLPRCGVEDTVGTFSMSSRGYDARGKYENQRSNKRRRSGRRRGKGNGKRRGGRGGKGGKGGRAKSRQKRYDLQGNSWNKKKLKYAILNYTPDMTRQDVRKAIARAFEYWSNASSLTFKYTEDKTKADIKISFGKSVHGDAYPFDGEGGTLAHAFFPESGEAHFDDAEMFSRKGEGKNLMTVAAHEFGHSLGLAHSSVPNSLMAPFYQGYVENFKLDRDDIAAIQKLYGKNVDRKMERPTEPTSRPTDRPRVTKPTSKPRTDQPNKCLTDFDDVMSYTNSRSGVTTYAFKGKYYYKIDDYGVVSGYPKKINRRWREIKHGIHAASFSSRTGRTYLFYGKKVYVFKGTKYLPDISAQVTTLLPEHPKAALSYGLDGLIHIFKKKNVYIFDDYKMTVSRAKHISSGWSGVPEDIDAAFTWERNGKTYFLKGNDYYKFNDRERQVVDGYPRNFNRQWLGCISNGNAKSLRAKQQASRNRRP